MITNRFLTIRATCCTSINNILIKNYHLQQKLNTIILDVGAYYVALFLDKIFIDKMLYLNNLYAKKNKQTHNYCSIYTFCCLKNANSSVVSKQKTHILYFAVLKSKKIINELCKIFE